MNHTKAIALGGVLAALAVVLMCFGGMIPMATYVTPVLCIMMLTAVMKLCGKRIAWSWYAAVTVLALLLDPDKEAAAIFLSFGFYPLIKWKLEKLPLPWLWKLIFFNGVTLVCYWVLLRVIGLSELVNDFKDLGVALAIITLILGNLTFLILDRVITRFSGIQRKKHGT